MHWRAACSRSESVLECSSEVPKQVWPSDHELILLRTRIRSSTKHLAEAIWLRVSMCWAASLVKKSSSMTSSSLTPRTLCTRQAKRPDSVA